MISLLFQYIMFTCTSSVDVDLQRRLLDSSLASCELVYYTLQQLGDTIGDKWLHNRLRPAHNSSSMNHNAISACGYSGCS